MTIKEFYEWACAHNCENYQFGISIDEEFVEDYGADGYDTDDRFYCSEVGSENELRIGELFIGDQPSVPCVWIEGRENWQ